MITTIEGGKKSDNKPDSDTNAQELNQFTPTSDRIPATDTASSDNKNGGTQQKSGFNFLMQCTLGLDLSDYDGDANFCFVSVWSVSTGNDSLTTLAATNTPGNGQSGVQIDLSYNFLFLSAAIIGQWYQLLDSTSHADTLPAADLNDAYL